MQQKHPLKCNKRDDKKYNKDNKGVTNKTKKQFVLFVITLLSLFEKKSDGRGGRYDLSNTSIQGIHVGGRDCRAPRNGHTY